MLGDVHHDLHARPHQVQQQGWQPPVRVRNSWNKNIITNKDENDDEDDTCECKVSDDVKGSSPEENCERTDTEQREGQVNDGADHAGHEDDDDDLE